MNLPENEIIDFLLVGDSRVWSGIENFDTCLNILNIGTPGVGSNIIHRKFTEVLSKNRVNCIIVEVETLMKPNSFQFYLKSHYLKYMFGQKKKFAKFKSLDGYDNLDFVIPMYRYIGGANRIQLIKDIIGYSNGDTDHNGFKFKQTDENTHYIGSTFESNYSYFTLTKLNCLYESIIESGIDCHIIEMPYYNFRPCLTDIKPLRALDIIRYDSTYNSSDFYDGNHLNAQGRQKFTADLISSVNIKR